MKFQHDISQMCAAFDVTRSGYHAWEKSRASVREQADAALLPKIRDLHRKHKGRYGAPRIQQALAKQGQSHGIKRIARLMKQSGLHGLCSRRYVPRTTQSNHDETIAPNHLANVSAATGPNQIWVSDLTYVPTQEGWLYVAVVLDLWSRRVVGWSTGTRLQSCLAVAALRMALRHRKPAQGLIHHSDRGVQYASREYRDVLSAGDIQPSMSRSGNPYDNAAMESFMATYKRECVGLSGDYETRTQASADFFEYVETYYNRTRFHSALGFKSPVDFENQLN